MYKPFSSRKNIFPNHLVGKVSRYDPFSKSLKHVIIAMVVLFGILLTGTFGYMLLEDWHILDAVWMSIITMSTVGFSEVVPLDAAGRVLTIFIIVSTILVGGYAVGNIGAFFLGGEVLNILRGHKLERDLERLKDHTILVGYGGIGREAAAELTSVNLVIVEHDPNAVKDAREDGFLTIEGDATYDSILRRAGIEQADGILVATGDVANNVLISLTARELNPDIFISARGDEPGSERKLKLAGANRVVLPSQIGGRRMAAFLKNPTVVDFLDLVMHGSDLSLRLQEFEVAERCSLSGKTLKESDIRKASGGALIMSVKHRDAGLIVAPPPDYRIEAGDMLIALGTDSSLESVCRLAGGD